MLDVLKCVVRACCAGSVVLVLAACGGGGGAGSAVTPATGVPVSGAPSTTPAVVEPPDAAEPTNSPPLISGSPATTAAVADRYRFQAQAADADGDSLSYQIANKPVWAQFDDRAGRLEGTPTDEHIGTYRNIRVSVTDGEFTASLAPFTITVEAIGNGQVTLSWQPPTANTDGSPLTDLDGYRIYYGREPDELHRMVKVSAGVTTAVVENLADGTWHFAMTAVNAADIEGPMSATVSKAT